MGNERRGDPLWSLIRIDMFIAGGQTRGGQTRGSAPTTWMILILFFILYPLSFSYAAPNAPTINQIEGNNVVAGQTLYLGISANITVTGNAEANKTIKIFDGAAQIATGASDGTGAYSIDINLAAGAHSLTAVANDVSGDSSPSTAADVMIDLTAPTANAYNKSVWQGDAPWVRSELSALYAIVSDGASGLDFTTATASLWNNTASVAVPGSISNNGTDRIDFIPTAGYGSGSFTDTHNYTLTISIKDKAGNLKSATNTFTVDYTFQYTGAANGAIPRYMYDPNHAIALGLGQLGSGEPGTNNPQVVAGYGAGWVNYYPNMYIYTNPTKLIMEIVPCQISQWMNGPDLVGYGEYYENWNGGWWYSFLAGGPWPTKTLDGSCMFETTSWTRAFTMPPQPTINNWFYIRDSAYNRTTEDQARYYIAQGTPPEPWVNWAGAGIDTEVYVTESTVIPTITGTVTSMTEDQTVTFWGHNIPYGALQAVVPAGQTNFTIVNTGGYTYFDTGGGDLNIRGSNSYGDGPTGRFRVYTDHEVPVVNYYSIDQGEYFSASNVDSSVTVRVDNLPYWGEAYVNVWAFQTGVSKVEILNNGGGVISGNATGWTRITGSDNWNGLLDITDIAFAEGEHTIRVYAKDRLGNESTTTDRKFRIDTTAPNSINVVPASTSTVSSIPSFNADIVDPDLINAPPGMPGSGASLNLLQNQIDPYRRIGTICNVLSASQLRCSVDTPVSGQAVDHRGNVVPTGGGLPAGAAIQIWNMSSAPPEIVGITVVGNSTNSNATLDVNAGGNIDLTLTVGSLNGANSYTVFYLIPHFDSNDGVQKVAAVPTEPATQQGFYAARITGIDKVGNQGTTVSTNNIEMDPPTGVITLTPNPTDVYILSPVSGACSGAGSTTACTTITSSVIKGLSGTVVPDGTLVTVALDNAALGAIVEGDANGIAADGHQVTTFGGVITLHVRAIDSNTFGDDLKVTADVGDAHGEILVDMRKPVVSMTKSADFASRTPGQVLTYTINYSNTGNSDANNVVITDRLPADVTYNAGTTELNAVPQADGVVFNAGNGPSGEIAVPVGTVAAGGSGNIKFKVTVK